MKSKIIEITKNNLEKINRYHRYHEETHQEIDVTFDLNFWMKSKNFILHVKDIHKYVLSIVNPYLEYIPEYQTLHEAYNQYINDIEEYFHQIGFEFDKVSDSYDLFYWEWNQTKIDIPESYFDRKKELPRNIFDRYITEKNIAILHGEALEGKTHTLIDITKKYYLDGCILIMFANFFEKISIKENMINVFNNEYEWHEILNILNNLGDHNNSFFTVIIDGINETPSFNKNDFWNELEDIQKDIEKYDYIKLLISIRTEYIEYKEYKEKYSYLKTSIPDIDSIINLSYSLGIGKYLDINNFYNDTPMGFFYIVADVLERLPINQQKSITNLTKQEVFSKRLSQVKDRCEAKCDLETTTFNMVMTKILNLVLENKSLKVDIKDFSNDEMLILSIMQEEQLILLNEYFGFIEFKYQYYADYYLIDYLEKNWSKKIDSIRNKVIDKVINAIEKISSQLLSIEALFIKLLCYVLKINKENLGYFIPKIISNVLIKNKYLTIINNIEGLSRTQIVILIENLRDKYNLEFPLVKILSNQELKEAWIISVKNISYEKIINNEKILNIINSTLFNIKDKVQCAFPNHLHLIYNFLFSRKLKYRDYYISKVLSHDGNVVIIQKYIDRMYRGDYKKLFDNFVIDKKKNEVYKLIYLLSVGMRDLRDRATITLIFLFQQNGKLYLELWEEFKYIDDPYIVERMYLIGYGILINTRYTEDNSQIAKTLYTFVYNSEKPPYTHIIIQEYALRIYIWMLSNGVWQEPYHSQKYNYKLPLVNEVNIKNKDKYLPHSFKSSIRLEYEGYGDWGRYQYESNFKRLLNNIFYETRYIDKRIFKHCKDGKNYIIERLLNDYLSLQYMNEEEFKKFDLPSSFYNDYSRQPQRQERYTKKIQWIGMFEYMAHVVNYYNYIPYLFTIESLLDNFDFTDDIKQKLSANKNNMIINNNCDCYYDSYINSLIYLSLPSNMNRNTYRYFINVTEDIYEHINIIKNQYELFSIHEKMNTINITNEDRSYIKNKFIINDNYVMINGVEDILSLKSITFGIKAFIEINNYKVDDGLSVYTSSYEYTELFLDVNSYSDNPYDLIWQTRSTIEYQYSFAFDNAKIVTDVLNPYLVSKYKLDRQNYKYYYNHKPVVKKENNLWYIHKDFLTTLINDGYDIRWYAYYEKMINKNALEWDGFIRLNKNKFRGKFKERGINHGDFNITMKL